MDMTKELFIQKTHAVIDIPRKVVIVNGIELPLTWHVLACLNKIKGGHWDVTVINPNKQAIHVICNY